MLVNYVVYGKGYKLIISKTQVKSKYLLIQLGMQIRRNRKKSPLSHFHLTLPHTSLSHGCLIRPREIVSTHPLFSIHLPFPFYLLVFLFRSVPEISPIFP